MSHFPDTIRGREVLSDMTPPCPRAFLRTSQEQVLDQNWQKILFHGGDDSYSNSFPWEVWDVQEDIFIPNQSTSDTEKAYMLLLDYTLEGGNRADEIHWRINIPGFFAFPNEGNGFEFNIERKETYYGSWSRPVWTGSQIRDAGFVIEARMESGGVSLLSNRNATLKNRSLAILRIG